MSLLSYKDAMPWAESLREQLATEAMPPWFADPAGPAVKGRHGLSSRELDVLLTWASGGTPEGAAATAAPVPPPAADWSAGAPDHIVEVPEVTLAPGAAEDRREVTVASGLTRDTWVRGADILPSDRSMVRSVTVTLENGTLLAAWVPGETMMPAPNGTAFKVPARAALNVTVHYRKNWQDEQVARSDRTRIGLYVTDEPISGRTIDTRPLTRTLTLTAPVRVLALRPLLDQPLEEVTVAATLPSGRTVVLLQLRGARPGWGRRYWLSEPIELPARTTITVQASGESPALGLDTVGL